MALVINGILGAVLVVIGLGIWFDRYPFVGWAAGWRSRLQGVLGEDFHIHDWVFAGGFLVAGGMALVSAFMMWSRTSYFFVL